MEIHMDDMKKLLEEIHLELGKSLLSQIKAGAVDARLLKEARDFLKDNSITYDPALKDKHMDQLKESVIEIEGIDFADSEKFKMVR
jgi:hypothetical protein